MKFSFSSGKRLFSKKIISKYFEKPCMKRNRSKTIKILRVVINGGASTLVGTNEWRRPYEWTKIERTRVERGGKKGGKDGQGAVVEEPAGRRGTGDIEPNALNKASVMELMTGCAPLALVTSPQACSRATYPRTDGCLFLPLTRDHLAYSSCTAN